MFREDLYLSLAPVPAWWKVLLVMLLLIVSGALYKLAKDEWNRRIK